MSKELPSPELLRKLLRYEPETGKLFWRERQVEMFTDGKYSAERSCAAWNSALVGKEALAAPHKEGYKQGRIFGRIYLAHRVIWAMVYGEWPLKCIDHISGVRDDNRIENLRAVSQAENSKNQKRRSNNISGVTGVIWHRPTQKWQAYIKINGNQKHLGLFTALNEAAAVRKAAEAEHGYHPNHGRVD